MQAWPFRVGAYTDRNKDSEPTRDAAKASPFHRSGASSVIDCALGEWKGKLGGAVWEEKGARWGERRQAGRP